MDVKPSLRLAPIGVFFALQTYRADQLKGLSRTCHGCIKISEAKHFLEHYSQCRNSFRGFADRYHTEGGSPALVLKPTFAEA